MLTIGRGTRQPGAAAALEARVPHRQPRRQLHERACKIVGLSALTRSFHGTQLHSRTGSRRQLHKRTPVCEILTGSFDGSPGPLPPL